MRHVCLSVSLSIVVCTAYLSYPKVAPNMSGRKYLCTTRMTSTIIHAQERLLLLSAYLVYFFNCASALCEERK
jgi:hypothetical protein